MKKLLILVILALGVSITSCRKSPRIVSFDTVNSRIKYIESTIIDGLGYQIISVDSIEYLCSRNGGIIKLK
jgi:hypothetical protein